jgi:isoprenylcysteine carboxyl methyltransferase (ICMT) family protein YpbQ
VVILPVFAVISRILYKTTKNPYLAGIIMALIITVMSCTNTLTVI